jgi:hypothetical protein
VFPWSQPSTFTLVGVADHGRGNSLLRFGAGVMPISKQQSWTFAPCFVARTKILLNSQRVLLGSVDCWLSPNNRQSLGDCLTEFPRESASRGVGFLLHRGVSCELAATEMSGISAVDHFLESNSGGN